MNKFHLGDILSITHGRLLSPTHMNGVYEILNYMTDDDLMTHALPRAARECAPSLMRQLPFLKEIGVESANKDNWISWLAELAEKYGEYHEVAKLAPWDHEHKDPISEAIEMVGEDRVLVVTDAD